MLEVRGKDSEKEGSGPAARVRVASRPDAFCGEAPVPVYG